jgi:hypothetical protein
MAAVVPQRDVALQSASGVAVDALVRDVQASSAGQPVERVARCGPGEAGAGGPVREVRAVAQPSAIGADDVGR